MAAANRRIADLKKEMGRLGEVNIGAIEEYKRVFERFEYLTTQRDDISKAKGELETIISEITLQMQVIFAERFKEINDSFSTTLCGNIRRGARRSLSWKTGTISSTAALKSGYSLPANRLKPLRFFRAARRLLLRSHCISLFSRSGRRRSVYSTRSKRRLMTSMLSGLPSI